LAGFDHREFYQHCGVTVRGKADPTEVFKFLWGHRSRESTPHRILKTFVGPLFGGKHTPQISATGLIALSGRPRLDPAAKCLGSADLFQELHPDAIENSGAIAGPCQVAVGFGFSPCDFSMFTPRSAYRSWAVNENAPPVKVVVFDPMAVDRDRADQPRQQSTGATTASSKIYRRPPLAHSKLHDMQPSYLQIYSA
jgi:hypothetical protein